jgi:hypothetical protein
MMNVEPFEINGKTVKDCYMINGNEKLVIEFTDGTKCTIKSTVVNIHTCSDCGYEVVIADTYTEIDIAK